MNMVALFVLLLVCSLACAENGAKPGARIRMTTKGMQYLADIGSQILQTELKKVKFDASGRSGDVSYRLSGTRIYAASFPSLRVTPKSGSGIEAVLSGATVGASGELAWAYHKWIFKFSGHIGFNLKARNVYVAATPVIGASAKGEPTIGLASCSASIGSVDISFHGSLLAWLYNLFRGLIGNKMKNVLNGKLCDIVRTEVETSARAELATFPVVLKLDKWSEIDYHLTSSPIYTNSYMDVFVKGEFKSVQKPTESKLVPDFQVSSTSEKMIYIWISEYTVNTCGEVYQRSKVLDAKIEAWNPDIPEAIRKQLSTSLIQYFVPNLRKYPNLPMAVRVMSRVAPNVIMKENNVGLFVLGDAIFSLRKKNGQEMEVFTLRLKINTALEVKIVTNRISGKIDSFNYNATVLKSDIGKIDASILNSPFVKSIIANVVKRGNVQLERGFPLPQLDHVVLKDIQVQLHKKAVRIGTNIYYNKMRSVETMMNFGEEVLNSDEKVTSSDGKEKERSDEEVIKRKSSDEEVIKRKSSDEEVIKRKSSDEAVIKRKSSDEKVIKRTSLRDKYIKFSAVY